MKRRPITTGIALPIIWGLTQGRSLAEVARGLMLRERTVVEAVEQHGPDWLAARVRHVWHGSAPLDQHLATRDWGYRNWARAREAAGTILDDLGEM
ncbi:MAG TPA: hypothetical protein VGN60_08990 [Devosia sp.]|jgi:phage terminase small subunit|nr:hypothetical protein [Devosia sp.]